MKILNLCQMVAEQAGEAEGDGPEGLGSGVSSLLAVIRKLRASLLEGRQRHEKELQALKQQLDRQTETLESAPDSAEIEKLELRLAGVNRLAAASKAKSERLETQLADSQGERSRLEAQVEQLGAQEDEIARLREQVFDMSAAARSAAEIALEQSRAMIATLEVTLRDTSEQLRDAQAELSRHQSQEVDSEDLVDQLRTQLEQIEQGNSHSDRDYENTLEMLRRENQQLREEIETLKSRLADLKAESQQDHTSVVNQLKESLAQNETLRTTLVNIDADRMELANLKDRIAHDLAEVRKKGSARLKQLEQNCQEIQDDRNATLEKLHQLKSELAISARIREHLQDQLTTNDEVDAENTGLKQKLIDQYRAIEAAEIEAKKAKEEAFESRKKVLEAHNLAESVESLKAGRLKAERRAENKESEVATIKTQLAESQRKYNELQSQMQDLRSLPSAASLTKFLGRITGPLRANSSDDDPSTQ